QPPRAGEALEVAAGQPNRVDVGVRLQHQGGVGGHRLVQQGRKAVEVAEGGDDAPLAVAEVVGDLALGGEADGPAEVAGQLVRVDVVRGGEHRQEGAVRAVQEDRLGDEVAAHAQPLGPLLRGE